MSTRDILKKDVHDLVPRGRRRRPLPEGRGIPGGEYSLKASVEILLRHSPESIDGEILKALKRYIADDSDRT